MKSCPQHREELAACAALPVDPSPVLARHLETCVPCRATLHALKDAAALQAQTAAGLPLPRHSPRLDISFLDRQSTAPTAAWPFTKLTLAVATVIVAALLFTISGTFRTKPQPRIAVAPPPQPPTPALNPPPNFSGATWHALRREIQSETIAAPDRPLGALSGPYRVKDAYVAQN
jgi:hypothetical protein